MENAEESALQYAERLGLFYRRLDTFSPRACLASLHHGLDSSRKSIEDESLFNCIDLPSSTIQFDIEPLNPVAQNESRHSPQTPTLFSTGLLNDLLLELPDMGVGSSIHCDEFYKIIGIRSSYDLAKQYLPLLSVDRKRDESLDFPPHVDRLNQALSYKVDYEKILPPNDIGGQDDGSTAVPDIFTVHENAVIPPQPLKTTQELGVCASTPSSSNSRTKAESLSDRCGKVHIDVQNGKHANESTSPSTIPEREASTPLENVRLECNKKKQVLPSSEAGISRSPLNSFFDDAFFTNDEQEDDVEIQNMASILDQIDGFLIPLPNTSTTETASLAAEAQVRLSTLQWEQHKRLPPLLTGTSLEENLPWAPLPPRRVFPFGEEEISVSSQKASEKAQERGKLEIGVLGCLKDNEIKECAESKILAQPQPRTQPLRSSLDSLIKLKLQRSMSVQVPPSTTKGQWPESQPQRSILPSVDDPGATSKLVSAFMTLRGANTHRSNVK